MRNEFGLIHYLSQYTQTNSKFIHTGIGDDAAVINVPPTYQLVSSVDTSVSGVHFPKETEAADIAYKSLAVSLSDMAAMGAEPIAVLLALTLPELDELWIQKFAQGFFELADEFKVPLVGGDTTQGPLTISTLVQGLVPNNRAILRSTAQPGDLIYVSGYLGTAGLALQQWQSGKLTDSRLKKALNRPSPRVALGLALRGLATAAIDISDGLAQDLGRILSASHVGAELQLETIPIAEIMTKHLTPEEAQQLALTAGDDYELCFSIAPQHQQTVAAIATQLELKLTSIGRVTQGSGLKIYNAQQQLVSVDATGYQHFKGE